MLGKMLGAIRVSKGLTLNQVCQGLCEESLLRKYENEQVEIEKLMADALMQRLGKSMDKYDIMLNVKEYRLAQKRIHLQELLRKGKLIQAEKVISEYENEIFVHPQLHHQFLIMQKADLLRRSNSNSEHQMKLVEEGIRQTILIETIEPEILNERCFSVMELMLIVRYAILLKEIGREYKAYEWFQSLILFLEHSDRDLSDQIKLYPIVAYQFAIICLRNRRYGKISYYIEKACNLLSQAKTQSTLFVRLIEVKCELAKKAECVFVTKEERECCKCIRELFQDNEEKWMLNWYPMYTEPHIQCINNVILERRKAMGISREELADGICDVKTLFRIEKCYSMPQKEIQKRLFGRLGISAEKYDGGIISVKYSDYWRLGELLKSIYERDYMSASYLFERISHNIDMSHITNRQFVRYWEAALRYGRKEITVEEYCKEIWELLQMTLPVLSNTFCKSISLLEYERRMLKMLAWYEEGERKIFVYDMLWRQYKKSMLQKAEKFLHVDFYSGITYCLIDYMIIQKKYKEAYVLSEEFLRQAYYMEKNIDLSRILYTRFELGLAYYKEDIELIEKYDILKYAKYAYIISKVYLRDQQICEYIKKAVSKLYDKECLETLFNVI